MKTKSRVMSLQASPISTRSHTPVLASRKMKKLNSREVINKLNQNVLKTRDLFDKQRPLCSYDGLLQPNMNIQVEDIEFLEKTASQNENLLNKIELDEWKRAKKLQILREKHENIENREFCKEIDSKFLVLKENEEREKVLEGRKYREDEFRAKKEVMAKLKLEEKRKNRDDLERSIVSHTNLCLFHAENSIKIQQEKQETRKSQLEFFLLRKETEHQDYIRAKRELHYETSLNLLSKYNISRDHSFQSYNRLQTTLKMVK